MRSALWSVVGGAPVGTTTVGAVPAVPTGERSAAGMVPTALGLPVVVGPAAGAVVAGVAVVAVLDESLGELLQALSVRAEADSTSSDQLRKRDMEGDPFNRRIRRAELVARVMGSVR